MRLIVDIETDDLKASVIWVIVTKNIDTGEVQTHFPPFKSFIELIPKVTMWIGHNILGFDLHVLNKLLDVHINPSPCVDTLVISRFLNFGIDGGHSLDAWGQRLGKLKGKFSDFSRLSDEMIAYCKQDVEVTHAIFNKFERYIYNPQFSSGLRTEHDMAYICHEIQTNGFYFDKEHAEKLRDEISKELETLDAFIKESFPPKAVFDGDLVLLRNKDGSTPVRIRNLVFADGQSGPVPEIAFESRVSRVRYEPFNPGSPKQIVERLNEAGWKPFDKTKGHLKAERDFKQSRNRLEREKLKQKLEEYAVTGWKVNEENLETLPETAPAAAKSLARRILLASRLSSLVEWLGKCSETDQRIHGNLFHIGAWTQRMSHDNPNTANIPSRHNRKGQVALYGSEFRSLWCVPPGRRLVGVDAEGIQLRVLAHYINDVTFTAGLVSGDKKFKTDIHSLNAALLSSGVGFDVSRDVAKTFIYSWLLGAGEGKTAEVLGCSVPAARSARGSFISGYPGLEFLKNEKIPKDASRGFFEGLDGRYVVCDSEHLMLAGYLQNGEAIIMKRANILWRSRLLKEKVPFWQVGFIHDEWQTETIDDDDVANFVAETQIQAIVDVGVELNLNCPLAGSKNIGYNWDQTH